MYNKTDPQCLIDCSLRIVLITSSGCSSVTTQLQKTTSLTGPLR